MSKLFIKRLSPHAVKPTMADPGAAGYDLAAAENTVVPAHGKALISTGWAIKTPDGYYSRIAPRSGLAWKNHIDVGAGVCDASYRGSVGVVLFNHASTDFKVSVGDRIAQLIVTKIDNPEVVEVDELDMTSRGTGGFGSTGLKSLTTSIPSVEEVKEASCR